jgi:hypothetical protein
MGYAADVSFKMRMVVAIETRYNLSQFPKVCVSSCLPRTCSTLDRNVMSRDTGGQAHA